MAPCPCGTDSSYEECCGPFHSGEAWPKTAEALMRSRYSAFAKSRIDWLQATTWPPNQKHFDLEGYRDRANNSLWLGLEILETTDGSPQDTRGTVTFLARSMVGGKLTEQREKSLFRKKQDRWYYVKPIS